MKLLLRLKGGAGSGHRGHAGRPGKRGGSVAGNIAMSIRTGRAAAIRAGWKPEQKFKAWANKTSGAISAAKKAVSKVAKRSKFSGNLAAYARHKQPAEGLLSIAQKLLRQKVSGIPDFDLDVWQDLGKRLNRVTTSLDKKMNG